MVSEEIRAMIPDYVRGLLSPGDAKEVEAALESSPEILPEFEAARAYFAALNQIPEVKAPTDFLDRVNRAIDVKPFWPRLRSFFFEPLYLKLPIELVGVAACFIITLVIINPFMPRDHLPKSKAVAAAHRRAERQKAADVARSAAVKTEKDKIALAEKQKPSAPAASAPTAPAELAFAKALEQGPAAEKKKDLLKQETLPAKKAEIKQEVLARAPAAPVAERPAAVVAPAATRPAAPAAPAKAVPAPPAEPAAPRSVAPSGVRRGAPSLDAIPTLPAATVAQALGMNDEATASYDIGTIELAYITPEKAETEKMQESAASSAQAAATGTAALILRTYDQHYLQTVRNGKVTYVCALKPDRLPALIEELGRPFNVTTHLFPYDEENTKLVTVSFILQ